VRVAQAMAEQRRRQRWRTVRNFGLIVVAIVAAIFVISLRSGSDKQPVASSSSSNPSSGAPGITVPPAGLTLSGDTPCPAADGTAARTTTFAKAPPMCIDAAKTYTATVETSKGTFTIALDAKGAPNTVNNFVVLSRFHFFDGVAFHRIIPGFVDQTGDAVGPTPGQGGPGYTIADELPTAASPYPEGAVAMANNSTPNTSGSQWFVVIGSGGSGLTASYNLLGTVTSGLDVAKTINAAGTSSGTPTETVIVTKVTIAES
jgi:peptidyl-prolyl cis-trans isomerase B (cyclophilin B)